VEYRVEPALRVAGADRQSVQQIVLNLALNALQASSAGGRVLLEASRDGGGQVVLRVTDEGPGVPPDLRERIFEPFFTTKQQGTGLGLAIVQKNVRHLGGELELISPVAQGHGTCFTIRLPAEGAI
jgi:signal transduction histidine kinase